MSISLSGMMWGSADVGWSRSLCLSARDDAEAADLARQLAPVMPSASASASARDAGDWFKISTEDVEEEAKEGRDAFAASISFMAWFLAWT